MGWVVFFSSLLVMYVSDCKLNTMEKVIRKAEWTEREMSSSDKNNVSISHTNL